MRFLADESCDFAVVRVLRSAGHDVLAVSEFQRRSVDEELMMVAELGPKLTGSFVVLRPGSARISKTPGIE